VVCRSQPMARLVGGPWNGREVSIHPSLPRFEVALPPTRGIRSYRDVGMLPPMEIAHDRGFYERVPHEDDLWLWHERHAEVRQLRRIALAYRAEARETYDDALRLGDELLVRMSEDLTADARAYEAQVARLLQPDPEPEAADWDQSNMRCRTCGDSAEHIDRRGGYCHCIEVQRAVAAWREEHSFTVTGNLSLTT
jgi:hypothetical protein